MAILETEECRVCVPVSYLLSAVTCRALQRMRSAHLTFSTPLSRHRVFTEQISALQMQPPRYTVFTLIFTCEQ